MSDGQSHGARDGYTPRGPIDSAIPNPPPGGTGKSDLKLGETFFLSKITLNGVEIDPALCPISFTTEPNMPAYPADNIFWFVFRESGDSPRVRHDTETEARREAERLARMNPGYEFHVCKCIGTVRKTDIAWTNRVDDRPF